MPSSLRDYRMPVRQEGKPKKKLLPWCWWERSYSNTMILRFQRIKKMNPLFRKNCMSQLYSSEVSGPGSKKKKKRNNDTQTDVSGCLFFKINRNLDWMKCEGWSGTLRHTYCAGTPEPSWLTTSKSAWVSEWARSDLICMRSTLALRTFTAEQRELHYKLKAASLNGYTCFLTLVRAFPFSLTESENDVAAINFAAHPPPRRLYNYQMNYVSFHYISNATMPVAKRLHSVKHFVI